MRPTGWRKWIMTVVFAFTVAFAAVQAVVWVGGGDVRQVPPFGGMIMLMAWMQLTTARSVQRRRNPSRAENGIQVAIAVLVATSGVVILIDGRSPLSLLVGIALLVFAVAAVVDVLLRGAPSQPDVAPRRAMSPP